jgi:hypothetical protein
MRERRQSKLLPAELEVATAKIEIGGRGVKI